MMQEQFRGEKVSTLACIRFKDAVQLPPMFSIIGRAALKLIGVALNDCNDEVVLSVKVSDQARTLIDMIEQLSCVKGKS